MSVSKNERGLWAMVRVISCVLLGVCYAYWSEAVAIGWLALLCSDASFHIKYSLGR